MLIGKSYSVTVMSREECIRVCHPISEFLCFVWGRLNRKARFETRNFLDRLFCLYFFLDVFFFCEFYGFSFGVGSNCW